MNTEQNYVGRDSHANTVEPTAKKATSKADNKVRSEAEARLKKDRRANPLPTLGSTILALVENAKSFGVLVNISIITKVEQHGTGNALNALSSDSTCSSNASVHRESSKRQLQLENENATLRNELAALQQYLNLAKQ